jgi:hypothetical protein
MVYLIAVVLCVVLFYDWLLSHWFASMIPTYYWRHRARSIQNEINCCLNPDLSQYPQQQFSL